MRLLLFCLLVGTVRVSDALNLQNTQEEAECEGTSEWKRDCNWCNCVRGRAICTEKACPPAPFDPNEEVCKNGARWRDGCNWCNCYKGVAACTIMACPPEVQKRAARNVPDINIPECTPGVTWKDDCNTCFCTENGFKACTLMACPGDRFRSPRSLEAGQRCLPGSRWMEKCNKCSCSDDGSKKVCSDLRCSAANNPDPNERTCSRGSVWMYECNICRCDRGRPACTKRLCRRKKRSLGESDCIGEGRWRKNCNWCRCGEGKALCTKRACPPSLRERIKDSPECEGNFTFRRDCNTCDCVDGRAICTTKDCDHVETPAELSVSVTRERIEPEAQCTNGSRWREDCNWCSCNENGVGICTLKGCPPEPTEEQRNEPECLGESSWKKDCNWCHCVQGRGVCTLKACAAAEPQTPASDIVVSHEAVEPQPTDELCTNGSRWRDDCNWCNCNAGIPLCSLALCTPEVLESMKDEPVCEGTSQWKEDCNWCHCVQGKAICTQQACSQEIGPSGGEIRTEVDVNITIDSNDAEVSCTNGSRWRRDCNWCSCSENGEAFCTYMFCIPPEEIQEEPECEGTSEWKRDCNWCNCVEGRAICTEKACLPDSFDPNEEVCKNGSRWREDCNWCNCDNGTAVCTLMACLPAEEQEPEPECLGTSSWKVDCNWCNCVEGRAVCTTQECSPEIRQEGEVTFKGRECNAGSSWKDECNYCHCGKKGISVCTKLDCEDGYVPPPGEPQCKEGSRWKKDCNWCRCENGAHVCREKKCDITRDTFPSNCTEGESWQEDCNTCTCSGGIPLCTLIACEEIPVVAKDLECVEGSSWSEDCNRCRCVNGSRVCTKRLCVRTVPEHCRLPAISPSARSCMGLLRKWTFDSVVEECREIIYGGCGGTENLFDSESECRVSCSPSDQGLVPRGADLAEETHRMEKGITRDKKRCLLPVDQGPCFGALPRFYYNKVTGTCERFTYGGCQGNRNKFQTAEECREACEGVAPPTDELCDRSQCPWEQWQHYVAKGCLPQYDDGSCCPTRFMCSMNGDSSLNKTQCVYRNKAYDIGEEVDVAHVCSTNCYCTESLLSSGTQIVCADIECPNLFTPPPPNCRPIYRIGDCCPHDYDCESDTGLEARTQTCTWGNNTYHLGSKMYFDEYPCQMCVCQAGFTGPFGPGCRKIDCGFEFRYTAPMEQGCVPVIFRDGCCPVEWICPDDPKIEEPVPAITKDDDVNACLLPKDPGSCLNDMTRIYYDAEASECRHFMYGGCQGNLNNFRTFEECEISCSKTPKPSQSECKKGGPVPAGPSIPQNVKVTALLNSGLPGRMSLQVEWSAPKCPHGTLKGYQVWIQALRPNDLPLVDKSISPKLTGPLITQLITGGLYLQQSYIIAVAAENGHKLGDLSPLVVFSLIPNYQRSDQCHLGSVSLKVGEFLKLSSCRIDCRCITPPDFTCTMHESCEKVTELQTYKNCPDIHCGTECSTLTDAITGCLTCLCKNDSFTCPEDQCPPSCETVIDHETGCLSCNCQCPVDAFGQPPCPTDCVTKMITNPVTGCQECICDPDIEASSEINLQSSSSHNCTENPPCPADCTGNVHMIMNNETGCLKCECDPRERESPSIARKLRSPQCHYPRGRIPCPRNCAVIRTIDRRTGCTVCICRPNNGQNPFVNIQFPTRRPSTSCFTDASGNPPCPQDCATIRTTDRNTGCETCICDPNATSNPFGPSFPVPPSPVRCPTDGNGNPPCPQDCVTIKIVDQTTGCEKCICDPNDTSNPFQPPFPPPTLPPRVNCPVDSNGNPPCPMDCGVITVTDRNTGCKKCICDPNDTGNPFQPPFPQPPPPRENCPVDSNGNPPCPQDCGVIIVTDSDTGCKKCICDPNDTGNPFQPPFPQPPPPPPRENCPVDSNGNPPCPQDCGVITVTDSDTGCKKCICDPNDTGNPFQPPFPQPPPPPQLNCPVDRDGNPPCPQDCAIIKVVDRNTGCQKCICDPNNTSNPFRPFITAPTRPSRAACPQDPPCPLDCAIIRVTDKTTGCEICKCDPNNTRNPFFPRFPPPPFQ